MKSTKRNGWDGNNLKYLNTLGWEQIPNGLKKLIQFILAMSTKLKVKKIKLQLYSEEKINLFQI